MNIKINIVERKEMLLYGKYICSCSTVKSFDISDDKFVRIPNKGEQLSICYDGGDDVAYYKVIDINTEFDNENLYICYTIYVA